LEVEINDKWRKILKLEKGFDNLILTHAAENMFSGRFRA
jgi:hypothetical protein